MSTSKHSIGPRNHRNFALEFLITTELQPLQCPINSQSFWINKNIHKLLANYVDNLFNRKSTLRNNLIGRIFWWCLWFDDGVQNDQYTKRANERTLHASAIALGHAGGMRGKKLVGCVIMICNLCSCKNHCESIKCWLLRIVLLFVLILLSAIVLRISHSIPRSLSHSAIDFSGLNKYQFPMYLFDKINWSRPFHPRFATTVAAQNHWKCLQCNGRVSFPSHSSAFTVWHAFIADTIILAFWAASNPLVLLARLYLFPNEIENLIQCVARC